MEISFQDLGDVFQQVFDLPAEERQACLDALCLHDAPLREEVESLLQAHDLAESYSGQSAAGETTRSTLSAQGWPVPREESGKRFGPYKVLGLIGEGGMGKVFLAARADQEFDQRVAIKTLRTFEKEGCERFRAERQMHAHLEHPGIARLYGGGTEDGIPYLVMEYIAGGRPIDQHCNELELGVSARLELFLEVLDAVAFSHLKGIVHRDLKPRNILVTPSGKPRLLDFGIARLLGAEVADSDRARESGLALTPAYASPEQLLGGSVTTATDVFSLGALLFALLSGCSPFARSLDERLCQLGEQESLPSLTSSARAQPGHPAARAWLALDRRRREDLEAIVAKALEPAKARRYGSVEQLAGDLENVRAGRPVMARRHSTSAQPSYWLQRHWLKAGIRGVGFLCLALSSLALAPRLRQIRRLHARRA